jgi:hypothetical protein
LVRVDLRLTDTPRDRRQLRPILANAALDPPQLHAKLLVNGIGVPRAATDT